MAKGRSMVASVLEETPEIGEDVHYVAAVVPIYKKWEGDMVRVIYINGTHEDRPYTAQYWKNRFLKYNGVSVSEQRAMLAEVSGRFRYTPFFTTAGFVMFIQLQVRGIRQVKDDSNLGFIAIDQIEKVDKIEFIKDTAFLADYPTARCAVRLRSGVLIPSYHSFLKTKEFWDSAEASHRNILSRHGLIINTRKQTTEKVEELRRSQVEGQKRQSLSSPIAEDSAETLHDLSKNVQACVESTRDAIYNVEENVEEPTQGEATVKPITQPKPF